MITGLASPHAVETSIRTLGQKPELLASLFADNELAARYGGYHARTTDELISMIDMLKPYPGVLEAAVQGSEDLIDFIYTAQERNQRILKEEAAPGQTTETDGVKKYLEALSSDPNAMLTANW